MLVSLFCDALRFTRYRRLDRALRLAILLLDTSKLQR